jgi:LacI family transcriptional regulator
MIENDGQEGSNGASAGRPTMRSVAALAGVGLKTVSRVINQEPHVSAEITERVQRAITMLDYRAHEQASSLRRLDGRTRTLGLLVGNVANPFSGAIHRGVEDVAHERGIAVFASSLDDDPARERSMVEAFLRRRVDGLILTTVADSQAYLAREIDRGLPVVFVDREPIGVAGDLFASDNTEGARVLTDHLLAHGHSRITFLGDDPKIQTARLRKIGFVSAMTAAGYPASRLQVLEGLVGSEAASTAVTSLMNEPDPPTALLTSQNLITIGAIRALRAAGKHTTTALAGFDDVPLADLIEPGLTVVAQDARAIGQAAARRIFARLDGLQTPPARTLIPTELIARGSGEIRPRD